MSYTVIAAAAGAAILTACGGGSGGNSSSAPATAPVTASSANVATPTYVASSAQLAVFQTINAARQACGYPTLTENTQLDQAAQAHASYMAQKGGAITDTEVQGNPGFTGVTYTDRNVAAGFPSSVFSSGESAGFFTTATLEQTQYGQNIAEAWLTGVYHIAAAT